MKKSYCILFLISGIFGASNLHAGCSSDGNGNYCESNVLHVGFGANGSSLWYEGVVYVTLSDDQSWFWDNSTAKNMTLSALLAAKASGQKVQVRWISGSQGVGQKKITSVLVIP